MLQFRNQLVVLALLLFGPSSANAWFSFNNLLCKLFWGQNNYLLIFLRQWVSHVLLLAFHIRCHAPLPSRE